MSAEEKMVDVVKSEGQGGGESHKAPGTFVLVLIFLAAFAVYFFANWKALTDVWPVR